jgi:hypothetical protein
MNAEAMAVNGAKTPISAGLRCAPGAIRAIVASVRRAASSVALVVSFLSTLSASAQEPLPPPPGPAPAPPEPAPAPATPPTTEPPVTPPPEPAPPATGGSVPGTAAPSTPVSIGTPSTSGTSPAPPPRVDTGAEPKPKAAASDPWQDAHALAIEANIYLSGRIGPSSIEPAEEVHFGAGFEGSLWYTLSREFVLGLGVTHADLGNVTAGSGTNGFDADYGVTALYLGVRAFPYRSKNAEVFIGLRAGLAWQAVEAIGVRTLEPNLAPPTSYACSGVDGPGFGLGAGIGGALRLGRQAWLTGHLDANGYKLTSDVIENCAVGIGSVTNVGIGAGVLYAFDLGADAALDARAPSRAQTW